MNGPLVAFLLFLIGPAISALAADSVSDRAIVNDEMASGVLSEYPYPTMAQVRLGDRDFLFVCDTGAATLVVDKSLQHLLGKLVDSGQGMALDGTLHTTELYSAPPISVGSFVVSEPGIAVFDLSNIRAAFGLPIQGMLGTPMFSSGVLQMDYTLHRWRLTRTLHQAGESVLVDLWHAIPSVTLPINGRRTDWVIDSGGQYGVMLASVDFDLLVAQGLLENDEPTDAAIATKNASFKAAKFVRGTFMGLELKGLEAIMGPQNCLGLGLLAHFNWSLDYPNRRFTYQPRHASYPLGYRPHLGATTQFVAQGMEVTKIKKGLPIDQAGLVDGDIITKLASATFPQLRQEDLFDVCVKHLGQSIPITWLRNGQVHTGNLAVPLPYTKMR